MNDKSPKTSSALRGSTERKKIEIESQPKHFSQGSLIEELSNRKKNMPKFCKTCGVDAPNAGQCGDVAGVRHEFIEGNAGDSILLFFNLVVN